MMTNDSKDQGREALSDEQWYDLASKHANSDWGGDGYLSAIKAVCADYSALATSASALARDEASVAAARSAERPFDHSPDFTPESYDDFVKRTERTREKFTYGAFKPTAEGTEKARDFMIGFMCSGMGSGIYDNYIRYELAGDFAWNLANALASPAASSAATVSDAASVALTDELPGATAALRDLLRAKDLPNEQGALSRVRGENMQKAWEHAREILATSRAATAEGAQDDSQERSENPEAARGVFALRDVITNLRETGWYRDEEGEDTEALDDLCRLLERADEPASDTQEAESLRAFDKSVIAGHKYDLESYSAGYIDARAASSATAPLTSDSEANQTLPQHAMPAWRDVVRERRRQIGVEGWTPEHDDGHDAGSLAAAGSAYAIAAADKLHPYSQGDADFYRQPPDAWPWHFKWWKPKDPRTALVKAGALILAEIERIDRAQSTNGEQS